MNIKQNVAGAVAAVGLVGLLYAVAPGREIKPIGWGDVNGDGVSDALLIDRPEGLTSGFWYTLGFVDGTRVQPDKEGTLRTKAPFEYFLIEGKQPSLNSSELRNFLTRQGITYTARVNRLGQRPGDCVNLTLYTNVDEEPGFNEEIFPCINRDL